MEQGSLQKWQDVIDYGALAARLRELRTNRRWSLERAAGAAGLTSSTLSRIETNRRLPSLEHLAALSATYGVALTDLLPPTISDPRIRAKTQRVHGMAVRILSPPNATLLVAELTLQKRSRRSETQVHPGREWIYVVSGVLSLTLGESDIVLRAGEAVEFDTRLPHAMSAESNSATAIAIYSEEGRRIHLRAVP